VEVRVETAHYTPLPLSSFVSFSLYSITKCMHFLILNTFLALIQGFNPSERFLHYNSFPILASSAMKLGRTSFSHQCHPRWFSLGWVEVVVIMIMMMMMLDYVQNRVQWRDSIRRNQMDAFLLGKNHALRISFKLNRKN
jgi:uncharacterized membrane protein